MAIQMLDSIVRIQYHIPFPQLQLISQLVAQSAIVIIRTILGLVFPVTFVIDSEVITSVFVVMATIAP